MMIISTQTQSDMNRNSEDNQDKYQQHLTMGMKEKRKDEERPSKDMLKSQEKN